MNVDELMSRKVVTIQDREPLSVAAQKMWEHDCGALPVVGEDGRVVGMLTDRDICIAAWSKGRALASITADEAMSRQVYCVRRDHDIGLAELLMAEHQVRRLPVVDASDRPIGVISVIDITREAVRAGSMLRDSGAQALNTLAAICHPRVRSNAA